MTTVSTQQVLDYTLEQISKEFNINHQTLVEKYGSIDTISSAIMTNKNNKKNVVRRVNKAVEAVVEEPKAEVVAEAVAEAAVVPVETPKKKVVRKVTKAVEAVVEEPKAEAVAEAALVPVETPKKKVVRKVTKAVEVVVEEPKAEVVAEEVVVPLDTPKKKVVRKVTKAVEPVVEEPKVELAPSTQGGNTEEKVKPAPKSIVKKVSSDINLASHDGIMVNNSTTGTDLERQAEPLNKNIVERFDDIDTNVYVDTQKYNDEDSDSLEPREINGVNYYVDSSNYVYHFETQDLIGKLNNKGDNIIFLSDF